MYVISLFYVECALHMLKVIPRESRTYPYEPGKNTLEKFILLIGIISRKTCSSLRLGMVLSSSYVFRFLLLSSSFIPVSLFSRQIAVVTRASTLSHNTPSTQFLRLPSRLLSTRPRHSSLMLHRRNPQTLRPSRSGLCSRHELVHHSS